MLIASAFKRSVMWSSAGFVQVGRSNQLFLLLINITWPAIIFFPRSLFASFTRSLVHLYLFFISLFLLSSIYPMAQFPSKNLQHFFITYGSTAKLQKVRSSSRELTEERDTRDQRWAFNLFYRNKISLCSFNNVKTKYRHI